MVNNWLKFTQAFLFPGICLVCGRNSGSGRDLCHACAGELPRNTSPCRCCALPLPAGPGPGTLCGACQKSAPPYTRVTAPWLYEGHVRTLHHAFKFERKLAAGRLLSELLADTIETAGEARPQLLIPVPLHPSRVRERGFNQAAELARTLSRRLDIPTDPFCMQRHKATAPQSGLNRQQRSRNIRNAFAIQGRLEVAHVALVDDVMTTGMTIEQAAKTLQRCGVGRIDAWVVARRP
ncbi:MAG: ComF family protein [Gammaproteobacteria bacterium]|jgi:ComF family protein